MIIVLVVGETVMRYGWSYACSKRKGIVWGINFTFIMRESGQVRPLGL